jgi:hypothetical protein
MGMPRSPFELHVEVWVVYIGLKSGAGVNFWVVYMPLSLHIQDQIGSGLLTPMKVSILPLYVKEQRIQIGVVTARVVSPRNNLGLRKY